MNGGPLARGWSSLDPGKWELAVEIFERALEVEPGARDSLISEAADGDEQIIATVRGMLSADEQTEDLIDSGVGSLAHIAIDTDNPRESLKTGDRVGDFEIIAELGRGGMGVV